MGELERIEAGVASWAQIVPDLDVGTMRTALLFSRVAMLGRRQIEDAFARVGLSAGEFDVLASLIHVAEHTSKPSTLARSGMLSPAGMTHRLDRLERAGFIERRPDADDRRSTFVVLTPAGRAKAIDAARVHVAAEAEFLDALSPRDRRDLGRLLETLIDAFAAVPVDGPAFCD